MHGCSIVTVDAGVDVTAFTLHIVTSYLADADVLFCDAVRDLGAEVCLLELTVNLNKRMHRPLRHSFKVTLLSAGLPAATR